MQHIYQNLTPEENLCNAIIMQAAEDFRRAHGATSNPAAIAEIRQFFKSPWAKALTKADPEAILEKLEEEFR